jgi:replicative DNA helicase
MSEEKFSSSNLIPSPNAIGCEKKLLDLILSNNNEFDRVADYLRPEQFAHPAHQVIFEAISKTLDRGEAAEINGVLDSMEPNKYLNKLGAIEYIESLQFSGEYVSEIGDNEHKNVINGYSKFGLSETCGRTIYYNHLRRELISLGNDIANEKVSEGYYEIFNRIDLPEQIGLIEQRLYELAMTSQIDGGFDSFESSIKEAILLADKAHSQKTINVGIFSGFRDIDSCLEGFHEGDLIILAGRPGAGKTTLAMDIALNVATNYASRFIERKSTRKETGESNGTVGYFTLGSPHHFAVQRMLAKSSNLSPVSIARGSLNDEEFERLIATAQGMHHTPIYFDPTPRISIFTIVTRARRLCSQHNLQFLVVDGLGKISGHHALTDRNDLHSDDVIVHRLGDLAKELNIPILVISNLYPESMNSPARPPTLEDIRFLGSIKDAADVVLILHREGHSVAAIRPQRVNSKSKEEYGKKYEIWAEQMDSAKDHAEIIIAKNRNRPLAEVALYFDSENNWFCDRDSLKAAFGHEGW